MLSFEVLIPQASENCAGLGRLDDLRLAGELFPVVSKNWAEHVPTEEDAPWLLTGEAAADLIEGRIDESELFQTVSMMYKRTCSSSDETIRA
jgi:hypothetical protein